MKHTVKITLILVMMFFISQLIGIYVANAYQPEIVGNETVYDIPYGLDPPEDVTPETSAVSIIVALVIAVILMLLLMKLQAKTFLRIWFLVVVILGIALALNAFFIKFENSAIIAIIIATPLAIIKIFKRNIIVHNITELLIYPGIATVFIPLLNVWTVIVLLIIISLYDMYAVWQAGFMQKMAKYQIETLRIFSGFFIPYLGKKEKLKLKKAKKAKIKKPQKIGVNIAILGGGDVVFPMLLAGVILGTMGAFQAIIIAITSTLALAGLFLMSQKGKFYPAMPFISVGCLIGLGIVYLI